jgi:hypothetical protein
MSMMSIKLVTAVAIAAAIFTAASAFAQEGVPSTPDSSYQAGPDAFPAPTDLAMPAPDDLSNPNSVTIPIPGGGEINIDGPDAPDNASIPTLPGSQWGNEKQNPFLHGAGPLGF